MCSLITQTSQQTITTGFIKIQIFQNINTSNSGICNKIQVKSKIQLLKLHSIETFNLILINWKSIKNLNAHSASAFETTPCTVYLKSFVVLCSLDWLFQTWITAKTKTLPKINLYNLLFAPQMVSTKICSWTYKRDIYCKLYNTKSRDMKCRHIYLSRKRFRSRIIIIKSILNILYCSVLNFSLSCLLQKYQNTGE